MNHKLFNKIANKLLFEVNPLKKFLQYFHH